MAVDYNAIPHEMRLYPSWICWRYAETDGKKPTKIPINPHTGQFASVSEAASWATFDVAVAAITTWQCSGLGFVLSNNDPYTFIDLDDPEGDAEKIKRHRSVCEKFDSYTELSPSGKGLHIIIKAHVAAGRKRSKIEMYSNVRYMTMTGDVFGESRPINEHQAIAQVLWEQLGAPSDAPTNSVVDQPQTSTDREIYDRAHNASNGELFLDLWEGRWEQRYPSQSEADLTMVDILVFYTQNKLQIKRLFWMCSLGQRPKAHREDYLESMILKAFDRQFPVMNIDIFNNMYNLWLEQKKTLAASNITIGEGFTGPIELVKHNLSPNNPLIVQARPPELSDAELEKLNDAMTYWKPYPIEPPEGLMGTMANFVYASSPRPVAATAITAAIGLMAGICGRCYNVSDTGLNVYVMLLAPTGVGKEGIVTGMNKLLSAVRKSVPAADTFRGPGDFSSGVSIHRVLEKKPCMVSVIGEFGLKMQQLASPRATGPEVSLLKALLDLFSKSGKDSVLDPSAYADMKNNAGAVYRPAFSLIGESTPEKMYSLLDESMINSGLLPRFIMIEYTGQRPYLNEKHKFVQPDAKMIQSLTELCAMSLTRQQENIVTEVMIDEPALKFFRHIEKITTDTVNNMTKDALKQLWSRAHLKALKLAALVAVGCNQLYPVITLSHAEWAYNLVVTDVLALTKRFQDGNIGVGTDEKEQANTIMKICLQYMEKDWSLLRSYKIIKSMHEERVIPYHYIAVRCNQCGIFRNDKYGLTNAIKRSIGMMLEVGDIQEVSGNIVKQRYNTAGRAFMVSPDRLPPIIPGQ